MRVQRIKSVLIAFCSLSLLTALLICVATLTPGWRSMNLRNSNRVSVGLFGFLCTSQGSKSTGGIGGDCDNWANSMATFERFTLVLCLLAFLTAFLGFVWALFIVADFLPEMDKPRWILPIFGTPTTLLAAVGLAVYFFSGCRETDTFSSLSSSSPGECSLGYSFFLAFAALLVSIGALLAGAVVVSLRKQLVLGTNSSY